MSKSELPVYVLNPIEYEEERLLIHDPVTTSFTKGKDQIKYTTSKIVYLNENGDECELYVTPPEQRVYISYQGPFGEDATEDNAKGIQVTYGLTSLNTVKEPTADEQAFIDFLDSLRTKVIEKCQSELELANELAAKAKKAKTKGKKLEYNVPANSITSFRAADAAFKGSGDMEDWDAAVKPLKSYKKDPKTKAVDEDSPMRFYVPFLTKGNGSKMSMQTKVNGPGNKPMHYRRFVGQPGIIEPVFHISHVYFGGHGTASYGASIRVLLAQANYGPIRASGVPPKMLIGGNKHEPIDDDEEETVNKTLPSKEELDEQEQDFQPEKVAKLEKIIKRKPAPKVFKKKVKKTIITDPDDEEE